MKALALDIGGSKLMVAAVDVDENRLEFGPVAHRPLAPDCNKEQLLEMIDRAVEELGPIEFERIGITIPGLADPESGLWVYACFSGIRDFPVAQIVSRRYGGRSVFIENDVNACALAEKSFGKCRDVDDFLWITVSNGIGGGLILDGKVYSGHFGGAAEIGHFGVVDSEAFQCACGNFGCLEAEAAGPGIARRYARSLQERGIDDPSKFLSAREIADLAKTGDATALVVIETTGILLGKAASYAVNLMNLEAVIFGGGVMESFDLIYPFMEQSFRSRLFRNANPSVRLEKTGLGYNAALAGAAALTLR